MNKRTGKRAAAFTVSAVMVMTSVIPCMADDKATEKEEVIYAVLNQSGDAQEINAVNIFESNNIIDYGNYTKVKNLTTLDNISQNGNKYQISTNADKLYYQGTMDSATALPWNISVEYYLDGSKITPEKLAGKSGELKIHFVITQNTECRTDTFYNNYALQATMLLDTELCSNIVADDATIANVGEDKQLTYTILPGQGIDTYITASVKDFEMDEVNVNGIKMNMGIDIDDEELKKAVDEMTDGTKSLNDGASLLNSGIDELKTGSDTIKDGLDTLNSKSLELNSGSYEILQGVKAIQAELSNVSAATDEIELLSKASSDIKTAIGQLNEAVSQISNATGYGQYEAVMLENGLDINALQSANEQLINEYEQQIKNLTDSINYMHGKEGYEAVIEQTGKQIESLQKSIAVIKGNQGAIMGMNSYLYSVSDALSELSKNTEMLNQMYKEFDDNIQQMVVMLRNQMLNMSELSGAINQLVLAYEQMYSGQSEYIDGVAAVVSGYNEMADGITSLASGSGELADGTSQLYEKTSEMNTDIKSVLDEWNNASDGETESFVSDENSNIKSVQFVMKTSAVKIADDTQQTVTQQEKQSFWQKLKSLFVK